MTVRKQLADVLKANLPDTYRIIPYQDNVDRLDSPVVMIKLSKIQPSPAAPLAAHLVTFTVTVADSHTDPERSEDALDDEVEDLLFALGKMPALAWTSADKVMFSEHYMAYDISLTVTTKKEVSE